MDGIIRARQQIRYKLQIAVGLLVVVAGFLVVYSYSSNPASAVTPPDSCFAFTAGTGTITDYYDHEGNDPFNSACPRAVDIPATIGGVAVTVIGPSAFQGKQLTAVTVPDGVTSIGDSAFRQNVIESVALPNSVTSIGTWAFYINKLTEIDIPDNLTGLSSAVFRSNQLTDVVLPDGITTIGSYAFENNPISSINIPHGVTSIGGLAFSGGNLTEIELPDTLTFIGERAFRHNNFETITIPASVNHMDWGAFQFNYQLKSAVFEGDVADLAHDTFQYNNLLKQISYNGIQYPAEGEVMDNEGCFWFNSGTVTGVNALNVNIIKDHGVSCLSKDVAIPAAIGGEPVVAIGNSAFNGAQLTSVVIPDSVTSIGNSAFSSNKLTDLHIGNSVDTVGGYAFAYNSLINPVFDAGNLTTVGDRVLYRNPVETLTVAGVDYSQADSISHEACYTFNSATGAVTGYNYIELKTIVSDGVVCWGGDLEIPSAIGGEAVVSIGNSAFSAYDITSVVIPEGVASIGQSAFTYNKITEVTVPNSLTSIGTAAFSLQTKWGADISNGNNDAPYIWSGDTDEIQQIYENIWYVKLYTANPSNPNSLSDAIVDEDWWMGWDANASSQNENLGGYLVNPAQLTLVYQNSVNHNLRTPRLFTGFSQGASYLGSYYVVDGPTMLLEWNEDWTDYTPESLQSISTALGSFYRLGETVTIYPPVIAGYTTPSPQVFTLTSATTEETILYTTSEDGVASGTGGLAETGASLALYALAGGLMIVGALALVRFSR